MLNFGKSYPYFLHILLVSFLFLGMSVVGMGQTTSTPDYIAVKNLCLSECSDSTAATQFRDLHTTKATSVLWNFGDPTSGDKNTSTRLNPAHLYNTPGTYTVTLTRTEASGPATYTKVITINQPPRPFYLGNDPSQQDTTICKGDKLKLDPYRTGGAEPQFKYIWFPKGDTTQTVLADSTTCYSVQVTDTLTGCSTENKLNVKLCVPPPPQPPKEYWYFGQGAGILFQNGEPTADGNGKTNSLEGVAGITDTKGNTIFYSDGKNVYRTDGTLMPSVSSSIPLAGSSTATQGVVIVPVPSCKGCQSTYYVFTTTDVNGTKQLTYSIVDMRRDSGLGKVIEKNIPLDTNSTTESIASVYVPKDSTYWVVSHDYGDNTFRMYRVTKNGVSISKTISIGAKIDSVGKAQGYLKFSQDGTKMAYVVPGPDRNYVEIYDFADSTGAISNKKVIDLGKAPPTLYGVEFSPDGNSLYTSLTAGVTTLPPADTTIKSQLLQFDLTSNDSATIGLSRKLIDSTSTKNFGALKIGPDSKIYMAVQGSTHLAVIGQPNIILQTGSKVDTLEYKQLGFDLAGKLSQLGLPNNTSVAPEQDQQSGISVGDTCLGAPTQFQANHLCGEKLKNTKTLWKVYKGPAPQQGQPETSLPVATLGGTGSEQDLQVSTTLSEPGLYHVTVTMANRCKSDTTLPAQEFTIKPMPNPDLGNDIQLCAASTTLDSKNTIANSRYFWQRDGGLLADTLSTLNVTQSGTYKVLVESDGCIKEDEIKVVLAQAPPFAVADTNICQNSSIILNAANPNFSNTTTYLWNTGATTPSITVSTTGKYTVTINTPIGSTQCTVSDDIQVTARPKATFNSAITNPTACNAQDGTIALTNFSPADNYSFIWKKNGSIIPSLRGSSLSGLGPGVYQVSISSPNTCYQNADFNLQPTRLPVTAITTLSTPVTCLTDGSITIALGATNQFIPARYVLLQQNNGVYDRIANGDMSGIFVRDREYRISNLGVGTYQIVLETVEGCQYTTSPITLLKVASTQLSIEPPVVKCEGESVTLTLNQTPTGTILWSTGATTPTINVQYAGIYSVTITSLDGKCNNSARTTVTFKASPRVSVTGPSFLCIGATPVQLRATPEGGTWGGSSNISATGLYTPATFIKTETITYSYTQNTCTGRGSVNISTVSKPYVDLGEDIVFCKNTSVIIGIPTDPNWTFRWNTGESTPQITPTKSGNYTLLVANGACNSSDDINVNILPIPFSSLKSEVPLCIADGKELELDPGNAGNTWQYEWSPSGATSQKIKVSSVGNYTVKITNLEGCSIKASTLVYDLCLPDIMVPNIFTPNNDGYNNTFKIFPRHILKEGFSLKIYNRWGELVFVSYDWEDEWDGKFKGVLAPPNSYAWEITYRPEYPEPNVGTPLQVKRGAVTVAW